MELDRARTKLADDPDSASELLVRAHDESKRAMVDLRGRISAPQVRLSSGAGDVTAQFTRPTKRLVVSSGAGDVRISVSR